jgi:3-phenylpropionate/trans-cinnamate dioxygenase ferredoxin subunit
MAAEFVTGIKTSEVPVRGVTAIDVRGTRIAVSNVGGTYYAFDDECTHEQCSLAEYGELAGTTLTCTCHGSEFDVRTGKVLARPATLPVKVYPVQVVASAERAGRRRHRFFEDAALPGARRGGAATSRAM